MDAGDDKFDTDAEVGGNAEVVPLTDLESAGDGPHPAHDGDDETMVYAKARRCRAPTPACIGITAVVLLLVLCVLVITKM